VLCAALSVRTGLGVSCGHPDTPVEPLIYTQTSRDVPRLAESVFQVAAERERRRASEACRGRPEAPECAQLFVIVDDSEGASWPWAWYLRDLSNVSYLPAASIATQAHPHTLVLANPASLSTPELSARSADGQRYHHRWWFPEEGYKQVSVEHVLSGGVLGSWVRFMANRIPEDRLGSLNGVALFPISEPAAQHQTGPQPPRP
jgi:hypothetical protein